MPITKIKLKIFLCSHWSGFLASTFKFLYHLKLIYAALQLHQTNHGSGEYHKHLCVRRERMIFSTHVANWWNIHTVLTLSPTPRRKMSNVQEKWYFGTEVFFYTKRKYHALIFINKITYFMGEKRTTEKHPKHFCGSIKTNQYFRNSAINIWLCWLILKNIKPASSDY